MIQTIITLNELKVANNIISLHKDAFYITNSFFSASVAEWLARPVQSLCRGYVGSIPVVVMAVVCLSLVLLIISWGYPVYGDVLCF